MRHTIIIFSFLLIATILNSVNIKSGAEPKHGTLVINVTGYKNNKGETRCQLWQNEEAFPTKTDSAMLKKVVKNDSLKSQIVFPNLSFGWYAVTVHQDEDGDTWMNKNWLGMPAEPYGLSNNPKILFSVPSFEDCKFLVDQDTVTITIKLKNT